MGHTYIECDCESSDHILRISSLKDDYYWLYVDVHLRKRPWWERIWIAIRYIFGYQSKYGAFDEFLWTKEQTQRFINTCQSWLDQSKVSE